MLRSSQIGPESDRFPLGALGCWLLVGSCWLVAAGWISCLLIGLSIGISIWGLARQMGPRGNQKGHFEQFWARLTKWAPEGLRMMTLSHFGSPVKPGAILIIKMHKFVPGHNFLTPRADRGIEIG